MDTLIEITIPAAGESVSEGMLANWLKANGNFVEEGEILFELETDKATLEVPSPGTGTLSIQVEANNDVSVGQTVGTIKVGERKRPAEQTQVVEPATQTSGQPPSQPAQSSAKPAETVSVDDPLLSPAVRRIVQEHNLDVGKIVGTGKDGRLTKGDVLQEIVHREGAPVTPRQEPRLIPLPTAALQEQPPRQGSPSVVPRASGDSDLQRRVAMNTLRKRIARNLVESQKKTAHLTTFNEIDMSEIITLRTMYKEQFEERHAVRLGFMSFFVKACCQALADYPALNAFVEEEEILYNSYYNIGVALSSKRGLIVPVIRNADRRDFADIETAILQFAHKARDKKIMPDDLAGGTFTITNGRHLWLYAFYTHPESTSDGHIGHARD